MPLAERFTDDPSRQPFELHPYLAGRLKRNFRVTNNAETITIQRDHTRWTGAPTDAHNAAVVAALGGSTTFGTKVTDADSWPALLQANLGEGYAVTNYGVPGYTSAEAIIQTALLLPEQAPRVIVFYGGWNDIRNYHNEALSPDYYTHGMSQYGNLGIPLTLQRERVIDAAVRVSALFALAHKVSELIPGPAPEPTIPADQIYRTPDPAVDRIYVRNLETLKTLASSRHATILFVPQVLNYAYFRRERGSTAWTPHIDNAAMPELMPRFNALMKTVCPATESDCAYLDEVDRMDWEATDFADEGHFNKRGGLQFSRLIADRIRATGHVRSEPVVGDPAHTRQ